MKNDVMKLTNNNIREKILLKYKKINIKKVKMK